MSTMNTFVRRIIRGLGVMGLVAALAMVILPNQMASAKTVSGGKAGSVPARGLGAMSIHVSSILDGANLEGPNDVTSIDGWLAASGVSDASGYYLTQVPAGTYMVMAVAPGFHELKVEDVVQSGSETKMALRLAQLPANTSLGSGVGTLIIQARIADPSGVLAGHRRGGRQGLPAGQRPAHHHRADQCER